MKVRKFSYAVISVLKAKEAMLNLWKRKAKYLFAVENFFLSCFNYANDALHNKLIEFSLFYNRELSTKPSLCILNKVSLHPHTYALRNLQHQ